MPHHDYSGYLLKRRLLLALALILLIFAGFCFGVSIDHAENVHNQMPAAFTGLGGILFCLLCLFLATRAPTQEIMRLAKENHGILTLSDIVTTLRISPKRAARALRILQSHRIASPRWQELRKNLWEFPDYMTLPLDESLELAQAHGGTLTLETLTAAGHSPQTARQTLDTLSEKGLAQPDTANPNSAEPALIVTTQ